jgi:putative phosphoesterase
VKIGVISDTHGYLDPQVLPFFESVEHIIHAGDIGPPSVIFELEQMAPVTAVLGNNDFGLQFRETEVLQLGGRTFFVRHIVVPDAPNDAINDRLAREHPDVVIFGHTHRPHCQRRGGMLYFNPGYAGKPRFKLPRSVAILHCEDEAVRPEYKAL